MKPNQLNTASYIRIYAERTATLATDGTAWADIARTLDRLRNKASGQPAYVTACIAHAWQTASTQADSTEARAEIYADMEMLEIYLLTH